MANKIRSVKRKDKFKKIREIFDSWDLKSLFTTLIILGILLILAFLFYFPGFRDRFRQADKEAFKGRTIAMIISIKPIETIIQGKYKGTQIKVDGFEVSYSYSVNGQTFVDSDLIPLNGWNMKFLKELSNKQPNDTIMAAFDISAPKNSVLIESQ